MSDPSNDMSWLQVEILPDGRMDTWNAARYLGLSRKTLATWRSEKIGPHYIKRGRVFYHKRDLDAWLNGDKGISGGTSNADR